jgi:hypothetical protein
MKRKKVLHLPFSVGGHSSGLSIAEKKAGYDSFVVFKKKSWLDYPSDLHLSEGLFSPIKNIVFFLKIRKKYDIFHFNYGSSLIDYNYLGILLLDVPFYKAGAKIIMTYNGSDARLCHPLNYWPQLSQPKHYFLRAVKYYIKKIKIKKASKYSNSILALNPDLLNYLPKNAKFFPYMISDWWDIQRDNYLVNNKIKIIHAPTSRDFKGTVYIEKALIELCRMYDNVEYEIVEKINHKDFLQKCKTADIVIDQVLIGWYGGLGVEVMKMGIPLAVYIRDEDLKHIPSKMARDLNKSVIKISPLNIVTVLAEYIKSPDKLYEYSNNGHDYVNRWHSPKYISQLLKKIYESK